MVIEIENIYKLSLINYYMDNKKTTKRIEDSENTNIKYVDMTQKELDKEILEETKHRDNLSVSEYDKKRIEDSKRMIESIETSLAAKKDEYNESIKDLKAYKKKEQKIIKENKKHIEEDTVYQNSRTKFIDNLISIKNNLKDNPNYYK